MYILNLKAGGKGREERERAREPDSRALELVSIESVTVSVSGWIPAFELGWGSWIVESSEGRRDPGGVKKASGGEGERQRREGGLERREERGLGYCRLRYSTPWHTSSSASVYSVSVDSHDELA
jgi:hypothetical protein